MEIKRGDIWVVDFGPPTGEDDHRQHGIRPVVIVSNNKANKHSTIFHVVPLTGQIDKKRYLPTHIFINAYKAKGLEEHSLALCEQLCRVEYGELVRRKGSLSMGQMIKVSLGMMIQLGIPVAYMEECA